MLFSKKMLIAVAALVVLSIPAFSFAASQDGVTKAGAMKEGHAVMGENKGKGASMDRNGTMMQEVVKNGTLIKDNMVKDNGMVKKQ